MECLRPATETLGACGGRVEAYPSSLAGAGGLGHTEPTRESRELICRTRGRGSCCHLELGFRVASVAPLLRLKSVGVKLSWLRSPRFSSGLCPAVTMAFAAVYTGCEASTQHTARNTQIFLCLLILVLPRVLPRIARRILRVSVLFRFASCWG